MHAHVDKMILQILCKVTLCTELNSRNKTDSAMKLCEYEIYFHLVITVNKRK